MAYTPPPLTTPVVLQGGYTPPSLSIPVVLSAGGSEFSITVSSNLDSVAGFFEASYTNPPVFGFISFSTATLTVDFRLHNLSGFLSLSDFTVFSVFRVHNSFNYLNLNVDFKFTNLINFTQDKQNFLEKELDSITIDFVGVVSYGLLSVTTSAVTTAITAIHLQGNSGNLSTTTNPVITVFSAHATTYGTFEKILPNVLVSTITARFVWFFTTLDIQIPHSVTSSILLVQPIGVNLALNTAATSCTFTGTVPLRYFVTLFSYLYPLQTIPITGIVYPTGHLQNNSLLLNSVSMSGIVPIAIEATFVTVTAPATFSSSGTSLIGVNLIPTTPSVLSQFFLRADLPKLVSMSLNVSCTGSFYGYTKNYGSLNVPTTQVTANFRILVPLFLEGTFNVTLAPFVQNPWIARVLNFGTFNTSLFSVISRFTLRCFIQGAISSTFTDNARSFVAIRKDIPSGPMNIVLGNNSISSDIYILGHSVLNFNATITDTISSRFLLLSTKIGVVLDLRSSSFTGPFFSSISFIRGSFIKTLPEISTILRGFIAVEGFIFEALPLHSNFSVLVTITINLDLNLEPVIQNIEGFVGLKEIYCHFNKTLDSILLTSNFHVGNTGTLRTTTANGSSSYLGSVPLRGTLSLQNLRYTTIFSTIFSTYIINGHLFSSTHPITTSILGLGSINGNLNLQLANCVYQSQGSHTFLILDINNFNCMTALILRAFVGGHWNSEIPNELSSTIKGGVPVHSYLLLELQNLTVVPFIRGRITTRVDLNLDRPFVVSSFYGTSTTGTFDSFFAQTSLEFYVKRGERQVSTISWTTENLISNFRLHINTEGTLAIQSNQVSTIIAGIVPFTYFGSFVSSINATVFSSIKILNLKYFYTDHWNGVISDIESFFYGSVLVAGQLSTTLTVSSYIEARTPIHITASITSELWSPSFESFGWIPLYGKLITSLRNDQILMQGSATTGRFVSTLSNFQYRLSGLIALRINVTMNLSLSVNPVFVSYGYLHLYRGTFNSQFTQSIYGEFRAHTPFVTSAVYYGSFLKTLSNVRSDIFIRLELVHGVITATLDTNLDLRGWSLLTAVLFVPSSRLSLKTDFEDGSHLVSGHADLDLTRNTTNSTTIALRVNFLGFTKVLTRINTVLSGISLKFNVDVHPAFRGYVDIRGAVLPTPTAIIRGIVPDFIYGSFESAPASLSTSDLVFTGITARRIFGILEPVLKDVVVKADLFFPFYLTINSTLDTFTWFGRASNFVVYFNTTLDDLNELENNIKGIAAIAIYGTFLSTVVDIYTPVRTFFRLRAPVYGNFTALMSSITGYFRVDAGVTGYIIGGDIVPCSAGNPCFDNSMLPPGVGYPVPKQYWTLAYTTSDIRLQYTEARRYGYLNGVLGSNGNVHVQHYIPELKKTITLIFSGSGSFTSIAIKGLAPVYGTFDCNQDYNVLNSFFGHEEVMIYGTLTVPCVGTFDATFRRGILTYISLRFLGTLGTLNKDLPLVTCESYGLIAVGGRLEQQLDPLGHSILATTPVPVFANLRIAALTTTLNFVAYTPFQVFGRFYNHYLFGLEGSFTLKTLLIGRIESLLDDTALFIVGRFSEVVGTFNVKLTRCLTKLIAEHFQPLFSIFGESNNSLQNVNFVFLLRVTNFGTFVESQKLPCQVAISIRVPIRIYATFVKSLNPLLPDFKLLVELSGNLNVTTANTVLNVSAEHIKPKVATFNATLQSVSSVISGLPFPAGHFISSLSTIVLDDIGVIGNSYGYINLTCDGILIVSSLWTSKKSLYLPYEKLYAIGGEVATTRPSKDSYRVSLYDLNSGELLQRITTLVVPYSYTFDKVEYGQFVVLATPLTGPFQSQAFSVSIDDEVVT